MKLEQRSGHHSSGESEARNSGGNVHGHNRTVSASGWRHNTHRFKAKYLPLISIIAIAAFLRLQHVDQPYVDAFAWRETSTAMMADNFYRGSWNIFYPEVSWGGPGPNYQGREFQTITYLAALLYKVFGQHDWVGRGLAAAFGLWGIFALYQLIRQVWDEERALAGAAVMAVLPGSVFIERSFLPDPAQVALLTTSLWMLVVYCRTERLRNLILATFFGALGCLTKLTGAILAIPALYIVVAILGPRLRQRRLPLQLGSAAIFTALPVVAYYLWARHLSLTYPPYHFAGDGKFLWHSGIQAWLQEVYFLPELFEQLVGWMWTWPFLAMAVVGLILSPSSAPATSNSSMSSSDVSRPRAPWLFHWWILAMVLRYLIEARHLVADPYNLHPINPAVAALAGQGLIWIIYSGNKLLRLRAARSIILGTVLLICMFYSHKSSAWLFGPYYYDHFVLGSKVRALSRPDDLIVLFGENPVAIYYSGRKGWVFPPVETWTSTIGWDYGVGDLRTLEILRHRGAKWLLIPASNSYTKGSGRAYLRSYYPDLLIHIESNSELVLEGSEGLIYRFESSRRQMARDHARHGSALRECQADEVDIGGKMVAVMSSLSSSQDWLVGPTLTGDKAAGGISIVVPVLDEAPCLALLVERLLAVAAEHALDLRQIVFVDDGSRDESWPVMRRLAVEHAPVEAIRLRRNFGKATALNVGIAASAGAIIVTMDADLQDDPAELPHLIGALDEGYDLVSGWKRERHDPLSKTVPSRLFNFVTARLTGVHLRDFNSGFKAYRREVFENVELYGELHRYVPVLAHSLGFRIGELAVRHHPRRFGRSKFGLERYLRGFIDLLTVLSITRYARRPGHLFGGIGSLLLVVGLVSLVYLIGLKAVTGADIGSRPLLMFGVLCTVAGLQVLFFGILAELINSRTRGPAMTALIRETATGAEGTPDEGAGREPADLARRARAEKG